MASSNTTGGSFLPAFKNPIQMRELAGSKRVIFEIDKTDMDNEAILEDDDELASEYDEDCPITDTDPIRYAAKTKRQGLMQSYRIHPEMNFSSFYDRDKMAEMKNILENGAVRLTVIQEGTGPKVPENCKVFVHYIICGNGMSDPFDSTILRGYPQCIDLRTPEVIPGLYHSIQSMHIREVAKVWIRNDYAYGVYGCPPRIPGNLDLHCLVEILDVIEEDQLKLVPYMTQEERSMLEFSKVYEAVKDLRTEGNGVYLESAYWPAIKKYRKAVNILEDYATQTQADQEKRQELLYTLYMNLSACYLKLRRPQQVCSCCKLALRSVQFSKTTAGAKLYYRFAEAKLILGNGQDAKNLNGEARRREPQDPLILDQRKRIDAQLETERMATKLTYTKLGKALCSSEPIPSRSSQNDNSTNSSSMRDTPLDSVSTNNGKKEVKPEIKVLTATPSNSVDTSKTEERASVERAASPPLEWEDYDFDGQLSEAASEVAGINIRH